MNRQDLFRLEEIAVTDALPVGLHYALSLVCFLSLALAPFFYRIYEKPWLAAQRRLASVGRSCLGCWAAATGACWTVLFGILFLSVILCGNGSFGLAVAVCGLVSLFASAFVGVCCLCTGDVAGCGTVASILGLVLSLLSGGILPPVMLPPVLRGIAPYTPITWLRGLLALPSGYSPSGYWLPTAFCAAGMLGLGFILYHRRFSREVTL